MDIFLLLFTKYFTTFNIFTSVTANNNNNYNNNNKIIIINIIVP